MNYFSPNWFLLLASALVGSAHGAITFNLNFIDGAGEIWSAERKSVVLQAANEWSGFFEDNETVALDLRFTSGTTYVAAWSTTVLANFGSSPRPWQGEGYSTFHRITVNTDYFAGDPGSSLWFDPTPSTDDDVAGQGFDALTIFRHELGHLFGIAMNFGREPYYVDDAGNPGEVDLWGLQVNGESVFDPGGLNVALTSDWGHVANSGVGAGDLMNAGIAPGERRDISDLNLGMLNHAFGYGVVAIPELATLGLGLGWLVALGAICHRRRR